jgi:nanoRNase/pAp phosphatase (c-di-AMP/oligoRNAs hydrolase)
MRAKYNYDVAKVAKAFGGGGHVGAAAYLSDKSIFEIEEDIKHEFSKQHSQSAVAKKLHM